VTSDKVTSDKVCIPDPLPQLDRAEQAEMAAFRLQATIYFLVKDIRAYITHERRYGRRGDDWLGALEQSAGVALSKLREDEPWRAVAMRIALLEERINGE
jgi:hypothetical protein